MIPSLILRFVLLGFALAALVSLLTGRNVLHQFKHGLRVSRGERAAAKLMRSGKNPAEFIAQIPNWAERHVRLMGQSFGEKLQYQRGDFSRLDAIIEKAWGKELPKDLEAMILTFGAYFGETIRRARGGKWSHDGERGYCLEGVGGAATVYPFEKVRKRFQNGPDDSLALFYSALSRMLDKK